MENNILKVYIKVDGDIERIEDSTFLINGSTNVNAVELLVPNTITSIASINSSYQRKDGFQIQFRQLAYFGVEDDYNVYKYTIKDTDRILEIAGQLQVSFAIKTSSQTIITPFVNCYVRRSLQPNALVENTVLQEAADYLDSVDVAVQAKINEKAVLRFSAMPELEDVQGVAFTLTQDDGLYKAGHIYIGDDDFIDITELELATKVEKKDATGTGAYVNVDGVEDMIPVSSNATGETIVQRTADGRIKAATPSENNDVVNKSYLESYVSSDLVKKTDTSDVATSGKVAKWNANGNIQTGTPTNNNEATNKAYVDANFVKTSDRSTTPVKGKVAQYSNDKTLQSEAPTLDKEVANKKYVDDSISALPQAIYEDTVVEGSSHPVKSSGLYTAFQSKADLVNGRVPVSQLPSYVDDVQNITTIGVVYPHISSLPVDGLYDGLILLCIGTNPNATDLEYATASQWSNGFLIKYVVDHWQLYDTLQPHKIYIAIDVNRAYRFTMSGDTHLTEIGGVGNLLPEIIITLQQMLSEYSATLTQSQANYIEDDTIGVFYISLPNGMAGYVYKNDKTHFYFMEFGSTLDKKYIVEYESATKVLAIVNLFTNTLLYNLEVGMNEQIEMYYQNSSGEPTYLRSYDKVLAATKEQTFTSEEKAQLWANLGLENLDEEDF